MESQVEGKTFQRVMRLRTTLWLSRQLHARPCGKCLARLLPGFSRAPLVFCLVLATHAIVPQVADAQADSAGEYEVKAAVLYNLMRFVEWPPSAYPDPQTPTVLCVLGRDPFGDALSSIVPKQASSGRPVVIRHPRDGKQAAGCHVLYIGSSERKLIVQILSDLKGSSVLTVGEMSKFAAHGGMIEFGLEDKQVRFDINLDAATRAGVTISSRLLVLARIVKEQGSNSGGRDSPVSSQVRPMAASRVPSSNQEFKRNSAQAAIFLKVSVERAVGR
jgi:uncharacterized protein DUF4154